jgi:hypothetical protein
MQRITESRIRESFNLIKTNFKGIEKNKIKFEIPILPDITICYNVRGKPEKDSMILTEKTIKIKIKAPFYIFNHLKLEYIKNRGIIEKSLNKKNNQITTTNIEKIIKFIREVVNTDIISTSFCSVFMDNKEFKENVEREAFINSNKNLWDMLANLSLHTWHRFFNVEMLELMVIKKNVNIADSVKNFYTQKDNNDLTMVVADKSKSIVEKIVYAYCDISKIEQTFGVKLIHKTINYNNKKFKNGFCSMRITWTYDNIGIIYLGFFNTFINVRRKIVEKLSQELLNYQGDFQITCSNRHITLLAPPIDSTQNTLWDSSASIFTYKPYKKLIDSYILKKEFKYTHPNKYLIERFIYFILHQRMKENFAILNTNSKGIILITKISVSKVKNIEEIENNKIISKKCLMLYNIQLSPSKEELIVELSVEPVSGYYLFRFTEKEAKIYDERKFFHSLINYYKNIDKEMFEYIKNFTYLMKESITMKLKKEVESSDEEIAFNKKNKQPNKNENFLHAYTCFVDVELKKPYHKLINQIELFKRDLKTFRENILEDKTRNRYSVEGVLKSLELVKEVEYKIFEKTDVTEFTIIEQTVIERFFFFFADLFNSIMDYKFNDNDRKM